MSPSICRTASRVAIECAHATPSFSSEFTLRARNCRRPISTYGYTQATALVYPNSGATSMVLGLHAHSISPPHSSLLTLRTLSAPLNPADINQIQGAYPTAPTFTTALGTSEPHAVPGNEACFEVLSAGSNAKTVKKGDWVIPRATGLGTWRTHLQCEEEEVVRVEKEGLDHKQVATVSVNPVTAWRMLKDFGIKEGEWFIQNGANSGVGRAAMQLGRLWGLKSIAIVRARPDEEGEKLKKELQELGANKVVTDKECKTTGFKDQLNEWTNGGREKISLGLNCVGGNSAITIAKFVSPGAHMVTYGAMSKISMKFAASLFIFKDITLRGFWVSRWADQHPDEKRSTVENILQLIREGKFKDVPMVEVPWNLDTEKKTLVDAVEGTLGGYRKGKGIFVFGDTEPHE